MWEVEHAESSIICAPLTFFSVNSSSCGGNAEIDLTITKRACFLYVYTFSYDGVNKKSQCIQILEIRQDAR